MLRHVALSSNRYTVTLLDEDDAPRDGATVTLTLLDGRLNTAPEVEGETWPVTLAPIGNDTGQYRYDAPPDIALVRGKTYLAVTDADLVGVIAHAEVLVVCEADRA